MNLRTIKTEKASIKDAVIELQEQLKGFEFNTLIYFASFSFEPKEIAAEMENGFSGKQVFGCSSYSEFFNDKELKNSIVAMAVNDEIIADIKIEVVENISEKVTVDAAFANFETHFGEPVSQMDYREYIGLVFIDYMTRSEEPFIDAIGNQTNVFFVGGSAADDMKFSHTYVFANGKAYENAAVLALIKMKTEFELIKTQSVKKQGKAFTITKAVPGERRIVELNGQPAAPFLSEMLGVPLDKLADMFFDNPVGLCIGEDVYVRCLNAVFEDGSVACHCAIEEGAEIEWFSNTDIVADTGQALEEKLQKLGNISGIIALNCSFRTLQLYHKNAMEDYAKLFQWPTVGFSSFGEFYLGFMNQTATMLVIK